MGIKEEVINMKKEVKNIQEQSFAMEILKDYKRSNEILEKTNKRQFITIIVILVMWFLTIGYLVYLLNDIGYEETTTETYDITQDIDDVNTINGNITNRGK